MYVHPSTDLIFFFPIIRFVLFYFQIDLYLSEKIIIHSLPQRNLKQLCCYGINTVARSNRSNRPGLIGSAAQIA